MDSRLGVSKPGEGFNGQAEAEAGKDLLPLPPWDMYTVAVSLFAGYILLPLLVSNLILLINPFLSNSTEMLVQQIATVISWSLIFGILQLRYGYLTRYLGVRIPKNMRYFLAETLKLLFLSSMIIIALSKVWEVLHAQYPNWSFLTEEPYAKASHSELLIIFVFSICSAPILEELIFRGLVQSTFHRISTPFRSVIFTSLVFLSLHGSYFSNIQALTTVLLLGLCFSIWRERTQSLLPSMVVHFINNVIASSLLFFK